MNEINEITVEDCLQEKTLIEQHQQDCPQCREQGVCEQPNLLLMDMVPCPVGLELMQEVIAATVNCVPIPQEILEARARGSHFALEESKTVQ